MLKLLSLLLLAASLEADSVEFFTNRAAWTAAVEAHDSQDKIVTEHFKHDQIHTGITLQSTPTFPQEGLVGAPGEIQNNEWSSFVHDGLANPRYDLLTFPKPVDAFGGNFAFRWSNSNDGLYFYLDGYRNFEPITRSGGPCGGYFGGQLWPPCPKNPPSLTKGFFGWIDYSATFGNIQITALDGDEPEVGHGGIGMSYTLDNLSFQDLSSVTPEPAAYAFMSLGLIAVALTRKRQKEV